MPYIEYILSITDRPKLLIASITREIISCMKSFYNLKFKTKQDRDSMGKVAFMHMNGDKRNFLFNFLNIFFAFRKA